MLITVLQEIMCHIGLYNLSNIFSLPRDWSNISRDRITGEYPKLLKTGSLDNAIREFSLVKPSWYMSRYTMIYKNGERMRDFLGLLVFIVV